MSNKALVNQRLFAFALMVKSSRVDSTLVMGNNKRLAAYFGLSDKSFTKYLNKAIAARIVFKRGNNWCFCSWRRILNVLKLQPQAKNFKKLLNRFDLSKLRLNEMAILVRDSLVEYKLLQQKFKIGISEDYRKVLKVLANGGNVGKNPLVFKAINAAKKMGMSTVKYADIALNSYIKTGSVHLSKIFKNSQSTLNKSLNNLSLKGIIKREIITHIFSGLKLSASSYDIDYSPNTFKSGKYFVRVIGSRITFVDCLL